MLGLGGISLFLTVVSTGYTLAKEIFHDLETNDKRGCDKFKKDFRKLSKTQRQKLMKDWMRDYQGDELMLSKLKRKLPKN